MRVELHILQSFPPANLNRDDTGTPKDCEFGGERRARISSQCIKRSIRLHPRFAQTLGADVALRTKRSTERVKALLAEHHGADDDTARVLADAAVSLLVSDVDDNGRTKVLYYAAPDELRDLAARAYAAAQKAPSETEAAAQARRALKAAEKAAADLPDDAEKTTQDQAKKAVDDARKAYGKAFDALKKKLGSDVTEFVRDHQGRARSVDVALFGRMLAERPELNLEAACQVAHAISTNRVSMEFDYYTAVDDLNPSEETGAGMIGTTGFNASCFYRYAVVDVAQLARSLSNGAGGDGYEQAKVGVRAFLEAAVAAIPSGKQNSFAAQARPALVLTVVRPADRMPMSLVNAFEDPARPGNGRSLLADSVLRLDCHWKDLNQMYGDDSYRAFLAVLDSAVPAGADGLRSDPRVAAGLSVPDLIDRTVAALDGEAAA